MSSSLEPQPPTGIRTSITCTKCGKAASVPFAPTPGRPVFCRDCFSKPPAGGSPRPAPGGAQGGGHSGAGNGNGGGGFRPNNFGAPPRVSIPRKRMMAQGRKTHFIYDAREALGRLEGGMDEKDVRAFLEGLFARGARISEEAAQEFLDEKDANGVITPAQRDALGHLVRRYSFYR